MKESLKKAKASFYVGINAGERSVFKSEFEPTEKSHGDLYAAVWGPFKTKRGAEFGCKYGRGNPHLQHVDDVEQVAKAEQTNKEENHVRKDKKTARRAQEKK